MGIKSTLLLLMFFCFFHLSAQTAKEKHDSTISESRSRHLVERFERSVLLPKDDIKSKIEKNKARRRAILWHIENSNLKEGQKNKLRKAMDKKTRSTLLLEFVVEHEEQINEYVKMILDS